MGSDSKTSGSGGGGGGGGQIPASLKKVVQNLKEIVNNNCADSEIYAVLRDCNMDPNEAVQRLLSQDNFHEVKSRRERRKEMKETKELKTRSNNSMSNHGIRAGSGHSFGQSGSIQIGSNEIGKVAYRKENGSVAYIPYSASSTLRSTGQTWNEQPSPQSDSINADNRRQSIGAGDMIDSSLQPSPGSRPTWTGVTFGHVSMADIVRMGRSQSKGSQIPCETPENAVSPNSAIYEMKPSRSTSPSQLGIHKDLLSSQLNMSCESGKKSSWQDFDNEWPLNEPVTAFSDISAMMYSNQSYLPSNRSNLSSNCCSDNILVSEGNAVRENISSDHVNSAQVSSKQIFMNDSAGTSEHQGDLCKDTRSSDSYRQNFVHQEGIGRGSKISVPNPTPSLSVDAIKALSSAAANMQQLSLGKEDWAVSPPEDNRRVVLPNHLRAFSTDCSHLSFGTYKSGKNTSLSRPQASSSMTNDSEEILPTSNGPSFVHSNSRNSVYCDEEQLELDFDTNVAAADARNYNSPKFLRAELRKLDIPDATAHENDYVSYSSVPSSSFANIQQLSSASSFVVDPNARNLPPFPSEVQSYSNSVPSDLLAATIQSIKARDSVAFVASQSILPRYSSSASSIKNPTASMSEVLSSGAFSVSHPSSLASNLATGPVPREHLSSHSYSQTGHPAIPQGHVYPSSALQQAYQDGNMFHESHAGMKYNLPHYRSATMSGFPLSAYQSLGNSADIPGSFLHDLSAGPAGSKVGNEDFLLSQYRDAGASFNLLQQNDGSARWDYGYGSRTILSIPDSAYYGLQGQNHQRAGYQHSLQQTQLHGALGYSQAGITIEQQQQQQKNLCNIILNGSRSPSSKQLPQIWQNGY